MTKIVIIGKKVRCKKAYSVTIRERGVNEKGKLTKRSLNSTSFQIKDVSGKSDLFKLKQHLIEALEGVI